MSEVAHHYFELAEELFLQAKITERLEENNITPGPTAYTVGLVCYTALAPCTCILIWQQSVTARAGKGQLT